jgi:hypothetical protein
MLLLLDVRFVQTDLWNGDLSFGLQYLNTMT